MTDIYSEAIGQRFDSMESGEQLDIEVGDDGYTRIVSPIDIQPEQQSMPASMTRKDRRGQEPTMTPMEGLQQFGEAMGGAVTGLLPGAVAGSVGAPGDIAALFAGAYEAATAEEGEGLNAFLQTLTDISGQYGSEAALNFGRSILEDLPVSEQVKEGVLGGLETGSLVGIGGAVTKGGKAIAEGVRDYASGAPARIAERGIGTTLQSGVDPMAAVDEAIVGAQKLLGVAPEGVTLKPASEVPKVNQLSPEYRVTVDGFTPEGTGKQAFVPKAITPKNFEQSSIKLDTLAEEFPDPLSSPESYALMMARANNRAEVQAPPAWMIEHANDPEKFSAWFKNLTPGQIQAADEGLAIQSKFQDAYRSGAGPQVTGQLMLWSILSRMLSAFPHESGYKDLAKAAMPFIDKASAGNWEKADTDAWLKLVKDTIPADSPGRSATSNANDFGKVFLAKMAQTDASGKSGLARLHELMADPSISSKDIRRQFYGIAQDTGIKNKILSFALLVSGRSDVVVLDRIQINRMWAGGDKVYDDIAAQFDGAQGLVHYEALERSLANKVPDLYNRVGRGDQGSVGRYHWESWVLSSGQVVAHPTLEGVVKTAKGGGVENIPVKEGRFHQRRYGAEYEKLPGGGHRYIYRTSEGSPFEFTKESLDKMFDQAFKKSSGVLPPDFPGVKAFEGKSTPWYEYEGVDRGKLDELIRSAGNPIK